MNLPVHYRRAAVAAAVLFPAFILRADVSDGGPIHQMARLEVEGRPSAAIRCLPPAHTETITAPEIEATINVMDVEDAVKYLPSIFIRKRNYGDTQPTIATRVWGVSSSARSLVYADGITLSALIANNNSIGAPRWGLVAPAEIERIDLMHGPFSAAYPGNSMGAVMEITTRMPDQTTASLAQTVAWQTFDQYGTRRTFDTQQLAGVVGTRRGRWSLWVSANGQDSHSQPLSYVTSAKAPAGTTGAYAAANKLGTPMMVLGASGLLHTRMANAKIKVAVDVTPLIRAAYTFGLWRNDGDAQAETYLRDQQGRPTYAGQNGFAGGIYQLTQAHSAHALSVASHTNSLWDFNAAVSAYRMDHDEQRFPGTVAGGTSVGQAGRVAVLGGTGWTTIDVRGVVRSATVQPVHVVTFGLHDDRYRLHNPTFATEDWSQGGPYTGTATQGDGKTHTQAAWAQHAWRLSPALKATWGARYESWRAYDGLNRNGATIVAQRAVTSHAVSPKATITWRVSDRWSLGASVAQAYRFATAAELYQLVSTGTTFTAPQPDLKPDKVRAIELKAERKIEGGRLRLSFFEDDVRDAIIAQFNPLVFGSSQLYSYLGNVDHVRARGLELVAEKNNVGLRGLDVSGSVTYVDARTRALSGSPGPNLPASAAVGKRLPNIPEWRAACVLTYRPDDRWTFTAAGRYSGMLFTTLDNADVNPNTWQGFGAWFVADVRAHCRLNDHWSASLGADNVLNRKYFLFHPFPQRTVIAEAKWTF